MSYYSQSKLSKSDEIAYRVKCIESIPKVDINEAEIYIAKSFHYHKQDARTEYESKLHPMFRSKSGRISTQHTDEDIYFGLLCELKVARIYGGEPLARKWFNDQVSQVERIRKENIFDCRDVGRTQIRGVDWRTDQMMSMIFREKDFRSKAHQPVICCVISIPEKWIRVCGWLSYDDIKNNMPNEVKYDPQGRGVAYWIPTYLLKPMESFDRQYLLM
jgi:hypothetical protein